MAMARVFAQATSVITSRFRLALRIGSMERCTAPFAAAASEPVASLSPAGQKESRRARRDRRLRGIPRQSGRATAGNTPGMELTSMRTLLPGHANMGSTRPLVLSCVSRTRLRKASVRRKRRGRCDGKLTRASLQRAAAASAPDNSSQWYRRAPLAKRRRLRFQPVPALRAMRARSSDQSRRIALAEKAQPVRPRKSIAANCEMRTGWRKHRVHFGVTHALQRMRINVFRRGGAIGDHFGYLRARRAQRVRQAIVRAVAARQQQARFPRSSAVSSRASDSPV